MADVLRDASCVYTLVQFLQRTRFTRLWFGARDTLRVRSVSVTSLKIDSMRRAFHSWRYFSMGFESSLRFVQVRIDCISTALNCPTSAAKSRSFAAQDSRVAAVLFASIFLLVLGGRKTETAFREIHAATGLLHGSHIASELPRLARPRNF